MNVDLLTGEIEDRSSLFQMILSGRQAQGPLSEVPVSWHSLESIGTWIREGSANSNEISKRDRQRKIRKPSQ